MGSAKAAAVLRPNARICLFWNVGHPPKELKERLDEVYAGLAPGLGRCSALLGNPHDRFETTADALRSSRAFSDVAVKVFTQAPGSTPRSSGWTSLPPTEIIDRCRRTSAISSSNQLATSSMMKAADSL
jgi:hypothetical protein